MKIEDQVCSFEQAKKLVKLGVILDTQWCWIRPTTYLEYKVALRHGMELSVEPFIPAPTVAELGILLPADCISVCNLWKYSSSRTRDYFIVKLTTFTTKHKDKFFSHKSEVQARTEALIWLIENHYIAAKDLKL